MTALPVSVRAVLWGTLALRGTVPFDDLDEAIAPDFDHAEGFAATVRMWGQLGERHLVVSLPRAGSTASTTPLGEAQGPAVDAGEAVLAPMLGEALVPDMATFGPEDDEGWRLDWHRHAAVPVAPHRLQAMRGERSGLKKALVLAAGELEAIDAAPLDGAALRQALLGYDTADDWGLPSRVPAPLVADIALAATVSAACEAGLDPAVQSVTGASTLARQEVLRRLGHEADAALARCVNAAMWEVASPVG